jgi:hypothetical protein
MSLQGVQDEVSHLNTISSQGYARLNTSLDNIDDFLNGLNGLTLHTEKLENLLFIILIVIAVAFSIIIVYYISIGIKLFFFTKGKN